MPPGNLERCLPTRDYADIARRVATATGDRTARMRIVADALWHGLADGGVSWIGFYLHEGADELVLGPMRNKPACSPIGLHGVCGAGFRTRRPQIIRDTAELGGAYVACDPRDRAEVVVPLLDDLGACWGVLDVDSHEVGAFDESDLRGLCDVLRAAGFSPAETAVESR